MESSLEDAFQQSTKFMFACYGHPECKSMTEAKQKIWLTKVSQSIGGASKIQSLRPANEAIKEKVARAHMQVVIWRQALEKQSSITGSPRTWMDQR